jgi:uncharacterized membrane protein
MNDEMVERLIGTVLRIGVILSAVIVGVGAVLYFAGPTASMRELTSFQGEPRTLRNVFSIINDAARLDGRGVIQLGIIVLIATPIARVLLSLVAFHLEKDRMYVGLTFVVLCILVYSVTGGF